VFYGLDPSNDVWADGIEGHGLDGIEFALHYRQRQLHVRVPLLGRHSVHNALAATAVGLSENLSWEEILRGLQDVSAQLRLLTVPGRHGATLLDDTYNASPHSMLAALNLLNDLSGRRTVILGDMLELGGYEQEAHRLVGMRAAQVAEVIIAVGQLGRLIGEAAQEVGHQRTFFAEDNTAAAQVYLGLARPGDLVLIKGSRGAHMEDIVTELAERGGEGDGS
jgi:UDP-N-acetylmuramoyl-tripeptide--D-alanyl-D-alanine ligase